MQLSQPGDLRSPGVWRTPIWHAGHCTVGGRDCQTPPISGCTNDRGHRARYHTKTPHRQRCTLPAQLAPIRSAPTGYTPSIETQLGQSAALALLRRTMVWKLLSRIGPLTCLTPSHSLQQLSPPSSIHTPFVSVSFKTNSIPMTRLHCIRSLSPKKRNGCLTGWNSTTRPSTVVG
jgi:hypothetical protein